MTEREKIQRIREGIRTIVQTHAAIVPIDLVDSVLGLLIIHDNDQKKLERAKAALEFYAAGEHKTCSCDDEWPDVNHKHEFECEDGTMARAALAELVKD